MAGSAVLDSVSEASSLFCSATCPMQTKGSIPYGKYFTCSPHHTHSLLLTASSEASQRFALLRDLKFFPAHTATLCALLTPPRPRSVSCPYPQSHLISPPVHRAWFADARRAGPSGCGQALEIRMRSKQDDPLAVSEAGGLCLLRRRTVPPVDREARLGDSDASVGQRSNGQLGCEASDASTGKHLSGASRLGASVGNASAPLLLRRGRRNNLFFPRCGPKRN